MSFSTILYYLLCSYAALFVLMTTAWLIQYKNGNAGIVDIFWGLSFPVSTIIYLCLTSYISAKAIVLSIMVLLWGLRLAIFLFDRNWNKHEDPRYTQLKKEWGNNAQLKMFLFFQFQGLLSSFLSLPFILLFLDPKENFSMFDLSAIAVWALALAGETIADQQMRAFKKNNHDKQKVCDTGLWYYSRHPNYFFEWLIWVAYFLFAVSSPYGWISIISPLLMLHFLLNVTGVKYSEAHMLASKGEPYRKYQETTSVFIPRNKL